MVISVSIRRFSVQTQAIYSELLEQLQIAELEGSMEQQGSFVKRTIKGNPYWYLRRRIGERINERYLGPETPELLQRIEKLKTEVKLAKNAARQRRDLIRKLRFEGYPVTDRRTGRVLEELARAGVFRLNGTLIGTHAFRCYAAALGIRLKEQFASTRDVDIAQDTSVSLGVTETADPKLGDALARAEKFVAIPALDLKSASTSWQTEDKSLRVDVLTPLIGKPRKGTVELPSLGAKAKPVRFLDFLLSENMPAAVLTGSGVLVRVPVPERYALHKLLVARYRPTGERDKSRKDLAQARILIEALLEDRPDDVGDAWDELVTHGKNWKGEAIKSIKQLPEDLKEKLQSLLGTG